MKNIIKIIKELSNSVDTYKEDGVVESLPVVAYVNRAKKLIDSEDYDTAEKILNQALDISNKDASVYKYFGAVYEKKGMNDLAVKNYQMSADLYPQDKVIWERLGFSLIAIKEYQRAEKSFKNAVKIRPLSTNAHTGLGLSFLKQKKFEEAEKELMTALNIDRYNFWALFLCAVAEMHMENYRDAEAKLSFLVKVSPNSANFFEYANLKFMEKNYKDAIHYAKKALELNPLMIPAYILLGTVYARTYDMEDSMKYFDIAFGNGPLNCDFYSAKGNALNLFERYSEAKEALSKAYELNPELPADGLALSCVMCGDYEEAEKFMEKIPDKDSVEFCRVKGMLHYKKGEFEQAVRYLKIDDENPVSCYYAGKCYELLNNGGKAAEYYENAVTLNPKYKAAYLDYIKYLISRGNYDLARLKLRKILKIYEDNVEFLNLSFLVSYELVKDNVCEYNIKETLLIAQKIETINPDLFEYKSEKQELADLLAKRDKKN